MLIKVPAVPVAQPRAKATMRGGHASVYNPKGPVDAFKATVKLAAAQAFSGPPLTGPLRVDCCFVFPRTKQQTWKRKPMPRLRHTKKPDADNVVKAVLDCLNQMLWVDDAQIVELSACKWIAAGDEQPHVVIEVEELEGEA